MRKLGLGLGLSRGRRGSPQIITATLTPVMSRLYDGQSVQDVTNYSTMVSLGNFASSLGAVDSADVTFQGDAASASDPLVTDEVAGFTVTVTDDATPENSRAFVTSQITVEYKLTFTQTEANEGEIDVNSLVPDAVGLGDIVVGSGPYAATYSGITAGDVRYGPFNFGDANTAGLPQISGTTGLGDTLTAITGFWTPDGLTFSYQWQSDGVDISGATSATFDITASEQGTDVTVDVTADDGVNTPVTASSAAVSIPSGSDTLTLTELGTNRTSTATNTTPFSEAVDFGSAATGQIGLVVIDYGKASGAGALGITFGGTPATQVIAEVPNINVNCEIWKFDASAGGSITIAAALVSGQWRSYEIKIYKASKSSGTVPTVTGYSDTNGTYSAMDVSASVVAGNEIIGCAMMGGMGTTGDITPVGLTQDGGASGLNGTKRNFFYEASPATTETRTMTLTPTGDGTGTVAAAIAVVS